MSLQYQRVRTYILQNFLFSDEAALLNDTDSLLGKGIIDSTGALELIHFLETEFGIKVDDTEMTPENLDSVEKIMALLKRKRSAT
jgi:acyl carrier protein